MATTLHDGPRRWSMSRDKDGYRTYRVKHLIECDALDGPALALQTPGLPQYGSEWDFDNDLDIYAWCGWEASIEPKVENEPNTFFEIEQTFSTKPDNNKRCRDTQAEDPLLDPPKISGSFVKYQEEATFDRFGLPIRTSSHEIIRGPQVEFDGTRFQVRIEKNFALLNLSLVAGFRDMVNDRVLWGLPARCIKLSNASWEQKFYGTCYKYYTWTYEFDIRLDTFDKDLLDEGTKVLNGHWSTSTGAWILDNIAGSAPNELNPQHFIRFKDRNGENARVLLNGHGLPASVEIGTGTGSPSGEVGTVHVEKYSQGNFLLLGIPATL